MPVNEKNKLEWIKLGIRYSFILIGLLTLGFITESLYGSILRMDPQGINQPGEFPSDQDLFPINNIISDQSVNKKIIKELENFCSEDIFYEAG